MKLKVRTISYLIFLIIYLEIVFKIAVYKTLIDIGVIYLVFFTLPIAFIVDWICKLTKEKVSKIIIPTFSIIITLYFVAQIVFFKLFSIPFSFSTIGLAENALEFREIAVEAILKNILSIIIMFVPTILYFVLRKKVSHNAHFKNIVYIIAIISSAIITLIAVNVDRKDIYSSYNLYYKINAQEKNIERFGLITATRLDLKRVIFGFDESIININAMPTNDEQLETEKIYGDNILEIDFEKLKSETTDENLLDMYEYIECTEPTKQNEYTGYFKGKNLIFILAEAFNEIAVSEELTPTLYKLINNGFVFENFYSPVFLSTTGGEFQATTGLIPTQDTLYTWKQTMPKISFALGNAFSRIGYTANGYHDWTYDYYSREKTMPTLGFSSYMGMGNGLEEFVDYTWLPSDLEMIQTTMQYYINSEPFVTYYVTVSGHAPYNFLGGNSTALKYKSMVENLPYDTGVKAYIASQIELDKALEEMIRELEENGKLANTVIALVGDHYPYTLTLDEVNSVSSYEKDEIVEVNKSNLIIWNSEMKEPITVEKVGSQIDVLPTLLNLFDIEYDSRLIMGTDILSSSNGLAIFSNRSWVSDYGTYFSNTKQFVLKEGKSVTDDYVETINGIVNNRFTISSYFIKYNIYEKIENILKNES